ncbi:MAG: alpha-D-ribose 1-methylphosphonate 5-triphosphate diphosphatase [Alphaproteobacteria bacterium]|jgi:alpha-D-ribose 1-methylphosphonate 5-triphosphate diphosphatase|nr:alpha-D-ribose 1-methylphosphonate 5-triphosphate diphosphatase [Alphaproteobacteria bacterium]
MNSEQIFTNAQIVLADQVVHGTVVIRDAAIVEISDTPRSSAAGAMDLDGDMLLPGLIELHTDNLEKHCVPRPSVHWPVPSAVLAHDAQIAAAGITTVFDAVAVGGAIDNDDREAMLAEAANAIRDAVRHGNLRATHYLHMRCEVSNPRALELYEPFRDEPLVKLVSLMDHTPGQRQFVDASKLKVYYQGKYGLNDAQFEEMVHSRKTNQALYSDKYRQTIAELCRATGVVMASHDDATDAHIDEAETLGVTIAEFPTTLEAAKAARSKGMTTIMGGPNVVRGGSHSGNVAASDLARNGLLDALSSDYVPSSLLHGAFLLHDDDGLDLAQAMATVTGNPARMVGLTDRGEIASGKRADLIRVRRLDDGTPVVRQTWRDGARVA